MVMAPPPAHADLIRGIGLLLAGLLEIPRATLAGTFNGPPVIGTALGALGGTINGIGYVTQGTLELLGSAIPLAKAVAPFLIPIFI